MKIFEALELAKEKNQTIRSNSLESIKQSPFSLCYWLLSEKENPTLLNNVKTLAKYLEVDDWELDGYEE